MKCIQAIKDGKNFKAGDILRVSSTEADNRVDIGYWKFIPKSEWKLATRVVSEKQEVETEKKERTLSKKTLRRMQIKEKQRPLD